MSFTLLQLEGMQMRNASPNNRLARKYKQFSMSSSRKPQIVVQVVFPWSSTYEHKRKKRRESKSTDSHGWSREQFRMKFPGNDSHWADCQKIPDMGYQVPWQPSAQPGLGSLLLLISYQSNWDSNSHHLHSPTFFFVCQSYRSCTKKKVVYWWYRLPWSDPKPAEGHHLVPLIKTKRG